MGLLQFGLNKQTHSASLIFIELEYKAKSYIYKRDRNINRCYITLRRKQANE